jgi:exopolysaccharide biosynthesis polyprenyl glycosylphosphotransferase
VLLQQYRSKGRAIGLMKVTTKLASLDAELQLPGMQRAVALHALPGGAGSHAPAAPTLLHGWHAHDADNDVVAEGVLARAEFLRMIQREKRRTDRSHSALSLAVLDFDCGLAGARDTLLDRVCAMVRETDYVAAIDVDGIAVLLPDTGEAGLRSFLDKVALARLGLVLSVTGATYSDPAFDRLMSERVAAARSRHAMDAPVAPPSETGYVLKRALDVVGAAFALIALLPLMVVVALLIKLTSRGPVIFTQQRIGQGGKPFVFYKFRSMRTGNDDRVHRDYVAGLIDGSHASGNNHAHEAGSFKMKEDPRVTPIGRFIRKTSIDEIPQFFNVLKGDMSLVGPRPAVPYEVDRYKGWHRRRVFELKPGLTGIWQVHGRSRVTFDEMVRMDLRYLRQCSLLFDLKILAKTVGVVLRCEGAR